MNKLQEIYIAKQTHTVLIKAHNRDSYNVKQTPNLKLNVLHSNTLNTRLFIVNIFNRWSYNQHFFYFKIRKLLISSIDDNYKSNAEPPVLGNDLQLLSMTFNYFQRPSKALEIVEVDNFRRKIRTSHKIKADDVDVLQIPVPGYPGIQSGKGVVDCDVPGGSQGRVHFLSTMAKNVQKDVVIRKRILILALFY